MDEEVDPDGENVNSVLAQESSELLHVLSGQSPAVIMKLCQMMPSDAGWNANMAPGSSSAAAAAETEHIEAMLEYFRVANAAECRNFLESMCLLCENIPMRLESRLMSVAGYASSEYKMMLWMLTSEASPGLEGSCWYFGGQEAYSMRSRFNKSLKLMLRHKMGII